MAITSFVSRMRNGSSTYNKEQGSTSTVSLHLQNGRVLPKEVQNPDGTTVTPPDFPPGHELWNPNQQLNNPDMIQNSNDQAVSKNRGISFKKRLFSRAGGQKLPSAQPMEGPIALSSNAKLDLFKMPNNEIDMVLVLQAIEKR